MDAPRLAPEGRNGSGSTSAPISTFCNPNDALTRQQTFCRGVQTTDANGWPSFTTIYPGWYSGRTPHIHATIRMNGNARVTTQFYFATIPRIRTGRTRTGPTRTTT